MVETIWEVDSEGTSSWGEATDALLEESVADIGGDDEEPVFASAADTEPEAPLLDSETADEVLENGGESADGESIPLPDGLREEPVLASASGAGLEMLLSHSEAADEVLENGGESADGESIPLPDSLGEEPAFAIAAGAGLEMPLLPSEAAEEVLEGGGESADGENIPLPDSLGEEPALASAAGAGLEIPLLHSEAAREMLENGGESADGENIPLPDSLGEDYFLKRLPLAIPGNRGPTESWSTTDSDGLGAYSLDVVAKCSTMSSSSSERSEPESHAELVDLSGLREQLRAIAVAVVDVQPTGRAAGKEVQDVPMKPFGLQQMQQPNDRVLPHLAAEQTDQDPLVEDQDPGQGDMESLDSFLEPVESRDQTHEASERRSAVTGAVASIDTPGKLAGDGDGGVEDLRAALAGSLAELGLAMERIGARGGASAMDA